MRLVGPAAATTVTVPTAENAQETMAFAVAAAVASVARAPAVAGARTAVAAASGVARAAVAAASARAAVAAASAGARAAAAVFVPVEKDASRSFGRLAAHRHH
jgi:hypothetical protein